MCKYIDENEEFHGDIIGKVITKLEITPDIDYLLFSTSVEDEFFAIRTMSECCSETWISDILNLDCVLNSEILEFKIISAKEIESLYIHLIEDERKEKRQDSQSCFGFKITTRKGFTDIIIRNSSNGYYTGDAKLIKLCQKPNWKFKNISSLQDFKGC